MPFADPNAVVIPSERQRQELGDIDELAKSILTVGQIQPILVEETPDGQLILIAGERRLRACQQLGRQVFYVTQKASQGMLLLSDTYSRKAIELAENIIRKPLTPLEQAKAIAELDKLMRDKLGSARPGPGIRDPNEGRWTAQDTADLIGASAASTVTRATQIAKIADAVPDDLKDAPLAQIELEMLRKIRNAARDELLRRHEKKPQSTVQQTKPSIDSLVVVSDCIEFMKKMQSETISLIITDPPFEMTLKRGMSGRPDTPTNYDTQSDALYDAFPQMCRVLKTNGWMLIFCTCQQWTWIYDHAERYGMSCFNFPIVWVKTDAAGNPVASFNPSPQSWPANAVEFVAMLKKGSPMVMQHRHNVIMLPRTDSRLRDHPVEKPVELIKYLLEWVYDPAIPGIIFDPFCGSGTTLEAAVEFSPKLQPLGCDTNPESVKLTRVRLLNKGCQ